MTVVIDRLAAAFRTAAFNRLMHEDGCPEGEQIRAGILAIAPEIYQAGQEAMREEAARVAAGLPSKQENGEDAPMWVAHSLYDNMRKHVAAAIRAIKVGDVP